MARLTIETGDLLDQPTEAIINAWNRNVIPWWLLLPQGVSGAIKRRAGLAPFREVGRLGPIPLGSAVATGAGRLPHRAIIHVAAINLLWRASERSITLATRNALNLAATLGLQSVAFPILGAGSGGFDPARAEQIMRAEIEAAPVEVAVVLVRYGKGSGRAGLGGR